MNHFILTKESHFIVLSGIDLLVETTIKFYCSMWWHLIYEAAVGVTNAICPVPLFPIFFQNY